MFSNLRGSWVLATLLCLYCGLFTVSCSLRLNEKSPDNALSVKTAGQGCFSGTSETFNRYIDGKSKSGEMNQFFDCLQTSLNTFLTNTVGADPASYNAGEFSRFLSHYVLKDKPLSSGLVNETMALKAALVGGDSVKVTRNEFQVLKRGVEVVREIFMKNEKIFPFTTEHLEAMPKEEVEQHLANIEVSLTSLGEFLKTNGQDYSFDRLAGFLKELFTYQDVDLTGETTSAKIYRLVPAIGAAKAILVAPPINTVAKTDWPRLATTLHHGAKIYLHFVNGKAGDVSILSGAKSTLVVDLIRDAVELIKLGMRAHPNAIIPPEEVDALAQALLKGNFLKHMDADFLHTQVNLIFKSLFKYGAEGNIKLGIAPGHLESILNHAEEWSESVAIAEQAGTALREQYYTKDSLLRYSEKDLVALSQWQNVNSQVAAKGIRSTITEIPMVFADMQYIRSGQPGLDQKFIVYLPSTGEVPLNSDHLKRMGIFRAASSLAFAFAGKSIDLPNPGNLPKVDYDAILDGIVPILIKYKMVASDFKHSMDSRFVESGLFLPHSNGDEILDFNEALELEALLLSTVEKATLLHKEIAEGHCRLPFREDLGDIPAVSRCVKEKFLEKISEYWSQVPKVMENVITTATSNADGAKLNRDAVFANLDSLTLVGRTGKPVGVEHLKADTQAWSLLPYYMDLVLKTHDKNRDDLIDLSEAMEAFPAYKAYLAIVIAKIKKNPDDVRRFIVKERHAVHIFLHLLRYGTTPQTLGEFNKWTALVDPYLKNGTIDPELEIHASRLRILDALVALAKEAAKVN